MKNAVLIASIERLNQSFEVANGPAGRSFLKRKPGVGFNKIVEGQRAGRSN
jgi:hypothetical protein